MPYLVTYILKKTMHSHFLNQQMKRSMILTKKSLLKFDFAIYFIKQEDSSWKISLYLLKMLNKLGGIIFDRFGESLKLLKKIIKQMQMMNYKKERQRVTSVHYLTSIKITEEVHSYRFNSSSSFAFHNKSLWIRKDKFGRFQ